MKQLSAWLVKRSLGQTRAERHGRCVHAIRRRGKAFASSRSIQRSVDGSRQLISSLPNPLVLTDLTIVKQRSGVSVLNPAYCTCFSRSNAVAWNKSSSI